MKGIFGKYKAFLKTGLLNVLAYKFNVFSWLFVSAASLVCLFFLWSAVYSNSPDAVINGFTFKEIVSYTVIVNIFGFVMGGGETQDIISDEIKHGTIAMSLIKPISYRLRFIFSSIGSLIASNVIIGIPLLVLATLILTANDFMEIESPGKFALFVLMFFVAQVLAKLLFDVIDYIFGLISFYTMASFGLFQIKEDVICFLSGVFIPLAFFPGWTEKLVNLLPFAGMAQNPTLIYLGRMSVTDALYTMGLQIIWLVILETFAYLFYQKAIKIVTIQGG